MRKAAIVLMILMTMLGLFLITGCKKQVVGGDKDEHGCIGSAGYSWCEAKQKCLRTWEEPCEEEASAGAKMSVSPASKSVTVGEVVNLEVTVSNVSELYGFQFDVRYDPAVLEFQKAEQGTFLSKNGQEQSFCIDYAVTPGLIRHIACTKLGGEGVDGSGLLEMLTFKAIAKGTSDITLSDVKLAKISADNIETVSSNGAIIVN